MLKRIKTWCLRKYYRFSSARAWADHKGQASWSDLDIPTAQGKIAARLFSAQGKDNRPLIVYFHGGGWVIGDLDTHTPFCHELHRRSGCNVISVDYRLAPEHPFPAGPDDCLTAATWIAEHTGEFGTGHTGIILAGDSAGANLATATCLDAEPALRDKVIGEIVIYPVVEHYNAGFNSYIERATSQLLTAKFMFMFWDTYLGGQSPQDPDTQRAFPLRSDKLSSLPPTYLVTAEFDPLRDEGFAYRDKLQEAGVVLRYRHFDNAAHGFACSEGFNGNHAKMMEDMLDWLEKLD